MLLTMDCESARIDVSDHGARMSGSGPKEYRESERSIRGFVEAATTAGYPVTLFVHPEVADAQADLLLELEREGTCLGLHLHPYKFAGDRYNHDLGSYSADEQRSILNEAIGVWENALGFKPRYFRAGYFSANDSTIAVLQSLGFAGGSLSNPGRIRSRCVPPHIGRFRLHRSARFCRLRTAGCPWTRRRTGLRVALHSPYLRPRQSHSRYSGPIRGRRARLWHDRHGYAQRPGLHRSEKSVPQKPGNDNLYTRRGV